jgi:hypothetical protein
MKFKKIKHIDISKCRMVIKVDDNIVGECDVSDYETRSEIINSIIPNSSLTFMLKS